MVTLLAFSQIVIAMAYVFIGWKVVAKMPVSRLTRWFGFLFFAGCAFTHLDLFIHTVYFSGWTFAHLSTQWHMYAIHIPQAIGAWGFAMNFFRDLEREKKITERLLRQAREAGKK